MNGKSIKLIAGVFAITAMQCSLNAVDMENVYINGFISQGYLKSSANSFGGDTEDGTWEFNEAAISIKALLADNLSAGIQLMSRDFGDSGNNDLKVDWAFLDYRANDSVGFRVGKFKKPEGIYNTIRDADSVRTSIMLPQGIYAERLRDINIAIQGLGVYGFLDMDSAGAIDYIAFLGNQPVDKEEPLIKNGLLSSFYGIANGGDIEFKYSWGGQLFWNTPVNGLRIGQSFNSAMMEINGVNSLYPWYSELIADAQLDVPVKLVSSIEFQREKITATAEYMYQKMEATNTPIGGVMTPYGFPSGGDYELEWESYYVQLTYQLTDKIQLGTYYSWFYETQSGILDKNDPSDYIKDWTVSTKYSINEWWILKAEVHFFDGFLNVELDESGVFEKDWQLFAIKSTISF